MTHVDIFVYEHQLIEHIYNIAVIEFKMDGVAFGGFR